MNRLKSAAVQHGPDLSMMVILVIWGCHYIVMKNGLATIPPLAYNALRFLIATPVMLLVTLRDPGLMRVSRRDFGLLALLTLIGPFGYQFFFALGLDRTTSTNSALLVATMPAWTELISVFMGLVMLRRNLLLGLALTLAGVALVVLGQGGASLSLSHDDLIGSALLLASAIIAALGNILAKPALDRLGGMALAVWTHYFTTLGMLIFAAPELLSVSISSLPRILPNLLYSGLLSGAAGFLVWNYALRELGPTRATSYHNFTPIIAAVAGILVLDDPLTAGLLVGGSLTLAGVLLVRQNTYLRQRPQPAPDAQPEFIASPSAAAREINAALDK